MPFLFYFLSASGLSSRVLPGRLTTIFFFHWCSSIHVKDLTKKAVLLVVHDNLKKLHPVKFQILLVYFGKLLRVPPTQFSTWRYTKLGLNDNWKFLKLSHFMIHQILSRACNLICLSTCSEAFEDKKKKKTCLGSCLRTLSSTTLNWALLFINCSFLRTHFV